MIYYMDNPQHRDELLRLAREGNHSAWVKESESSFGGGVYLMNLRYAAGVIAGDAKVAPQEPEAKQR